MCPLGVGGATADPLGVWTGVIGLPNDPTVRPLASHESSTLPLLLSSARIPSALRWACALDFTSLALSLSAVRSDGVDLLSGCMSADVGPLVAPAEEHGGSSEGAEVWERG